MSTSVDEFLTSPRSPGIVKLNQQTVRSQGTLPALHVGRRVRVRRSEFEALLDRGSTVRTAEPERSAAQAFWEGELLPVPAVEPGEGNLAARVRHRRAPGDARAPAARGV